MTINAATDRKELINRLQKDILQWEGYKPPPAGTHELIGLEPVEAIGEYIYCFPY